MKSLAADFKKRAWEALRPHYWLAFVASLIASFLGGAGSSGGGSFSFNNVNLETENGVVSWESMYAQLLELLPIILITTFVATGIGLAFQIFVGNVVEVGYRRFYLDLVDRRPLSLGQLFVYFRHYSGVVVTQLLRRLFIFLWSLLFLIPGIIAHYSYAMVPYILADDPTLPPREVLARSKAMMSGNRWRLFCLEFSFIGWILLSALTCCCAGVAATFLTPYQAAAYADFYREISDTRPLPPEEPASFEALSSPEDTAQ